MATPSSSAIPTLANKSPRKPTCAVALDVNLEELKRLQGLESLRPYVVKEKCFPASVIPSSTTPITIDELKKLARAWKLNERRNFWKTHTTQDQLVEVLRKHIQDTINPTSLPPVKPSAEQGATTIPSHPYATDSRSPTKRPATSFKPTFQTKDGEIRSYCGHRLQNKIRNSQDILSRSRHFAFPDETNNLLNMIYNWRAEDFSRHENADQDLPPLGGGKGMGDDGGNDLSLASLSMTSSKLETQAEQMKIQTLQHNKLIKQRALAIHLLQYTVSSKFSLSNMDRRSLETFLDVGESSSSDPDILMNSAIAISNLSSHPSLRPMLMELNVIHRYSSFLPLLVGSPPHISPPHTALAGGLFLYYMSCETEVEDRLCSSGFKTLQKNSLSDNFQLRLLTLQALSNLMPCQERIRVAELVVATLHQLYRDYLDETWNEDVLQVLLRVTSFSNCLRVMMEADVMDIISLAAAEVRDDVICGRLIARILSHFLHQLDLGEDLIHADFSRIFIDLLSLDDLEITELCMHAFAVMSSHDLLIQSVADSDIVHIVCGYIASSQGPITSSSSTSSSSAADSHSHSHSNTALSVQMQIIEDIARYLCNICQPSSKFLEQRVQDGAAHALLDLFRLCPNGNGASTGNGHPGTGKGTGKGKEKDKEKEKEQQDQERIQQYAIIGLRDLLTNLNNCHTLVSLLTPALLELLKLNVQLNQRLDVNVVQCVYNLCLCSDCHDYLLGLGLESSEQPQQQQGQGQGQGQELQETVDLVLFKILTESYQRESVSVIKALLQVLIILSDMEVVVLRLISNGILEFLVTLVEFTMGGSPSEVKALSVSASRHGAAIAAAAATSGGSGAGGGTGKECWNDISRLLLVMIHSQPHLSPAQENCIVKILPLIGTKAASEEIISDCAIVLAFLSYTLHNFSSVDPIVRSIIHLSESESVMDATSTVLYNISCSDLEQHDPLVTSSGGSSVSSSGGSSMLLSDGMLHVNMMIKMMRNGNTRIQQNIAETMKLLCIHSRCNELLLRHDLLSDFIVIALLRTNSSAVKKVCSEAFYNMLCHDSTRKRLLSGDLWWAMMRLSKTDLSSVRMICARAVDNLTCDPLNIKPLRNNYILSFIKEIAFEEQAQEYQDIFLRCLHRIIAYALQPTSSSSAAAGASSTSSTSSGILPLAIPTASATSSIPPPAHAPTITKSTSMISPFASSGHDPLNHTEMVAVIQILINALSKSTTVSSSQWIGYLLATVAKECLLLGTKEINEFIHMDLLSMLKIGSPIWIGDMICRRYFSTVLSLLCSEYAFTNATLITDLLPVLGILLNHEQAITRGPTGGSSGGLGSSLGDSKGGLSCVQPLPLDEVIAENVCAVLLSYAVRGQVDMIALISIPFFSTLMTYALTGISPYKLHIQQLQRQGLVAPTHNAAATLAPTADTQQRNELDSTGTGVAVCEEGEGIEMEMNAIVDEPVTTLCALFLKLLVFVLPKLFEPNAHHTAAAATSRLSNGSNSRGSNKVKAQSPAIEVISKVKSSIPMRAFLNTQLYLNEHTRNNALYLLQTICCASEDKTRELLQLNFFMLLYRLLTGAATGPAPAPTSSSSAPPPNTSPLFTSLPFLEFCSVFARNVSEYSGLHGLLVRSLDLDRFLMALVRFKDDVLLSLSSGSGGGSNGSTATGGVGVGGGGVSAASILTKNNLSVTSFEQDSLDRLYDITVMLYHLSRYRLYPSSGPSSALSGPSGTSSSSRLHVMTPLSVLNIISEVTSHANGDRLLSHITKLIIGLVVDKTEDGNGFDPSFIREILTEINDQDSLDEEQVAAFMRPKLTMRYLQLQGKGTSASGASSNSVSLCQSPQLQPLSLRTVEQRSLEVLSKEEINALWIPLISNERKKMEYFPVIASSAPSVPSAGGGVGAASSSLSIDAVLPFPMASYDKIIKRYPFVTEPVLLEAKREREDKILSSFALASATAAAGGRGGGGAGEGELGLGVLEEQEEMEDFPNTTTADFDERNGIPSPGHAAVERRDMASPVPPSPATSSYPLSSSLSPRPPESPQRSNPNMSHKSAGRLLVQAKGSGGGGGSSSSIHRDLSSSYDSTGSGSGARKRTASS